MKKINIILSLIFLLSLIIAYVPTITISSNEDNEAEEIHELGVDSGAELDNEKEGD